MPAMCRSRKLNATGSPEWEFIIYTGLSVTYFKESTFTPSGSPGVLADPAMFSFRITDNSYAMQTFICATNVGIYAICIREEVFKYVHHRRNRSMVGQVILTFCDICNRGGISDLYRSCITVRPHRTMRWLCPYIIVGKSCCVWKTGIIRNTTTLNL